MGTNTQVSDMRSGHIDTFARLSAKATHETQSFSTELQKTKKVPTNICHKPLLSQSLTKDFSVGIIK